MYTLELTDNYILIYNHKTKKILKEDLQTNIIVNNKIYDFIKLNRKIMEIINKYNLLNSFFKTKFNILVYEKLTPTEAYLLKNIFKTISNINVNLIHVNNLFDNNHLFISGNVLYYNDKRVDKLSKKEYKLVGYNSNYFNLKERITNKYNIKILSYENSNTLIFDKVICLLLIILIV